MVHAAEVQEQMGKIAEAAESYQQALLLDETKSEPQATATDWFNYAQFLRRQKQPERLVYACLYRAEDIMSTNPGETLDAIVSGAERECSEAWGGIPFGACKPVEAIVGSSFFAEHRVHEPSSRSEVRSCASIKITSSRANWSRIRLKTVD